MTKKQFISSHCRWPSTQAHFAPSDDGNEYKREMLAARVVESARIFNRAILAHKMSNEPLDLRAVIRAEEMLLSNVVAYEALEFKEGE